MKNRSIAFVFSLLTLACNGSSTEDGGIVIPDAAVAHDAGNDAGIGGGSDAATDGGIYCGSTVPDLMYWGRLPESCLPRCTHETLEALTHCTTIECQTMTLDMDPTPPVIVQTRNGDKDVSCGGMTDGTHFSCVSWQMISCDAELCRDEYYAVWTCTADCDDEADALLTCRSTNTDWMTCTGQRQAECFAQ